MFLDVIFSVTDRSDNEKISLQPLIENAVESNFFSNLARPWSSGGSRSSSSCWG